VKDEAQPERERILCIRLSGLGDVVHALNALSVLRAARPEAFIAWAVEERFGGLLRAHPYLDELIAIPRTAWGRMLRNPLRWPALIAQRRALAARLATARWDASVDFQSSFKSSWLVRAAAAPVRIGFGGAVNRERNRRVQNRLVEVPSRGIHRIERDLALLGPLGVAPEYADAVLASEQDAGSFVRRVLADSLTGGPVVVIHPGTSAAAAFKRWPPERYAAVGDGLVRERGADVVVTCGPGEGELAGRLLGAMAERRVFVPPDGGLMGLVELLRRADLFIGSDTGPMHIASALKRPVVALFGPKDPVQTGPYGSRSVVVTADVDCRPCTRRRCRHVRCMLQIDAERVLAAALAVLDGGGQCAAERRSEGRSPNP